MPSRGRGGIGVLDAVGGTSLVRPRAVVPEGAAEVLVKLECENPTGSLKDRMARAVIERAEADGRLRPGGTVVEHAGANVVAALRVAERPGPGRRVVTLVCDSGLKYLSTNLDRG